MSNWPHWTKPQRKLLTPAIVLAAVLLAVLFYFNRTPLLEQASDRLGQWGRGEVSAHPDRAVWLLTAATKLRPTRMDYGRDLAHAYLSLNRPDDALAELGVPVTGPLATDQSLARAAAELELGQSGQAGSDAARAAAGSSTAQVVLAGEIMLAAGLNPPPNSLVTAPEALQRIQTAHASTTALAADLYARGLLNSAGALLAKDVHPTTDGYKLLAAIKSSHQDWAGTRGALLAGIKLNPADSSLHQALIDADRHLSNAAEIYHQQQLLGELASGKI